MTLVGVSQCASPICQVIYGFALLWKLIVFVCFLCSNLCRVRERGRGGERGRGRCTAGLYATFVCPRPSEGGRTKLAGSLEYSLASLRSNLSMNYSQWFVTATFFNIFSWRARDMHDIYFYIIFCSKPDTYPQSNIRRPTDTEHQITYMKCSIIIVLYWRLTPSKYILLGILLRGSVFERIVASYSVSLFRSISA